MRVELPRVQWRPYGQPKQARHSSGEFGKSVCIPERQAVTEQIADLFGDRRVEEAAGDDGGIEFRLHGSVKAPLAVGLAFRLDLNGKERGHLGPVVTVDHDDRRPAVDDRAPVL